VIRILHPLDYIEASKRLHVWIGGINTVVLLTSSLAVAIAVQAARIGNARAAAWSLLAAAALGIGFLGIKAYEYTVEYHEGLLPVRWGELRFSSQVDHQFMNLYLIATALHAVHLTIGILLLAGLAGALLLRKRLLRNAALIVAVFGVYWHLVDIVWIFLYPTLYLAR
jgi:cytochrome c oxidase subunit 3